MAVTPRAATAEAGPTGIDPNQVQFQLGASGDSVKALQQHLLNWGFNPGPVDGKMGQATVDALKQFQTYHKIPVTGNATNETVQYLQSNALWEAVRQGFHSPGQEPGVPLGPTNLTMPPTGGEAIDSRLTAGTLAPPAPAPGSGGGGGGGGGGGRDDLASTDTPTAPKTDAEVEAFIRQKYGSYAWMLDDPAFSEIRAKLWEAAKNEWGEQELLATLKNTEWWNTHEKSTREWDITKNTAGTAQVAALLDKSGLTVGQMASKMGIELTGERLAWLSEEYYRRGWDKNPAMLQSAIAAEAQYKPDFGGDIGNFETLAKNMARDYLMPLADTAAFDMAKKWAAGEIDEDNVRQTFMTQAKGLIPAFAQQIEQGLTPRQLLAPQINATAQLLEIDPESLDLVNDQRFNPIISSRDATGKPSIMTLSETQKHVKSLDDYWTTGNANKEVSSIVNGLARTFGQIK